ncbi:BON domain-containing protein [Lysobacter sp. GX 14042]|uniref:BON domain-containing protein n=1 Tax=Lysobacter sp. GX 14042 TaxID=2907155 RepID=UPI001F2A3EC5|nr:BON domain-containing protein [Lysobacter sp. GX 14042]MCE7032610.1 BON domain-containing protein [Lysobacter sp. GX 14042]
MRNQQKDVGDELKAVAQDMLALGARAMRTGREWLSDWRNDMQGNDNDNRSRRREHARRGQGGHGPDYYASQDYGRGQAYGQDGLHAEYGSYGGSYRDAQGEDNRFGERQQPGRRHGGSWQERGQGRGQSQWSRGGSDYRDGDHSGGGDYGSHSQGYAGRDQENRMGTGYGSSSSYGSPQEHSYAGDYRQPGFVSPADTQFRSGQYGSGRYSGYGPRNYTRPDARISEDLCERLTHDPDIDPSDIEVRVSEGTVTLEGTVEHRWMKHRAEDLADSCSGVRHVENRIRVQSASTGSSGGSGGGAGAGAGAHGGGSTGRSSQASGGSETGAPSTPTSRAAASERTGGTSVGGSPSELGSRPGA